MKRTITLCLMLAIALASIPVGLGIKARLDASAQIARQESALALDYQRQINTLAIVERSQTSGARVITGWGLAGALLLAGALALAVARHRFLLAPVIKVGGQPVARQIITDPAYVEQALALAALAIAESTKQRQALADAAALMLASRYPQNTKNVYNRLGATESAEMGQGLIITQPAPESKPPSLAELARRRMLAPGQPLIAGYQGADPKYIPISLFHNGQVAGQPGMGKTNTIRYIAGMAAIQGASIAIIDPHEGNEESLADALAPLESRYLAAPATDAAQALATVQIITTMGEARRTGADSSRDPIWIFIDEIGVVLRWFGPEERDHFLGQLVSAAQQYRKYGLGITFGGQIPIKGRLGADLRASIATVYCHRLHRDQAKYLLPSGAASMAEGLGVGQAVGYLSDGSAASVLAIPHATAADLEIIAQLAPPKRYRSAAEAPSEAVFIAAESPKPRSADQQAIYSAFCAGEDISAIARRLNEGKTSGDGYQKKLAIVNAAIREGLA
jgi:hypothetical protein